MKTYQPLKGFQVSAKAYQIIEINQKDLDEYIEDGAFVVIPPGGRMKNSVFAPTDIYSAARFAQWLQDAYRNGWNDASGAITTAIASPKAKGAK